MVVYFGFFRLYRGLWRFASLPDLLRILKAISLGCLIVILVTSMFLKSQYIPRTVLFLSPLLLVAFLVGSRLAYRLFKDRRLQINNKRGQRTLVVGAGRTGELLLRNLLTRDEYQPIAFVDDDKEKQGREVHGVRVCGQLKDVKKLIRFFRIQLVLFAIPSIQKHIVNRLITDCVTVGVECKTLPSIHEQSNNGMIATQLRPLILDDLLGRDSVQLDQRKIAAYLQGKTILITGGGGSIGSELCRQIAMLNPRRIIIFDHGEYNLYSIDHELRGKFSNLDIVTVLGDVRDRERIHGLFQDVKP